MPETILNIFDGDAFGTVELTEKVVEKVDYKPDLLGGMGIFEPIYSRSRTIAIASTDRGMTLIPTSETGAPPAELIPPGAKVRAFKTHRLAKGRTITAEELQGVLALPRPQQVKEIQKELSDTIGMLSDDMELTWEHMRLGTVFGKVMDADGTTVLYDWYEEWDIAIPSEINFDLANPDADLRKKFRDLKRGMQKSAKGRWTPRSKIIGLASDEFYDGVINNKQYKETRLQNDRTKELENIEGYSSIEFEGVILINYRGTDDGTTLAVPAGKVKFFPRGVRGAFQVGWAPAEFFPYVNQKGKPSYSMILKDLQRDAWRRPELYSYPLFVCTAPEMLRTGKIAA